MKLAAQLQANYDQVSFKLFTYYEQRTTEQHRLILRVARIFGEPSSRAICGLPSILPSCMMIGISRGARPMRSPQAFLNFERTLANAGAAWEQLIGVELLLLPFPEDVNYVTTERFRHLILSHIFVSVRFWPYGQKALSGRRWPCERDDSSTREWLYETGSTYSRGEAPHCRGDASTECLDCASTARERC
jgi:hypothetical protein